MAMRQAGVEMNPEILSGASVFAGTRVLVRGIAEMLADGAGYEELYEDYGLSRERIEAAMAWLER